MYLLRRFSTSVKASSLLESVIALCIISVCLSVAVMVYAAVFDPRRGIAPKIATQQLDDSFFLMQVKDQDLPGVVSEARAALGGVTTYALTVADSAGVSRKRTVYILNEN